MKTKTLVNAGFHNNPAKDFFLYFLLFISLAFITFGTGTLLFQFINKFVPSSLGTGISFFDQDSVKFGIASILIASPLFFFLSGVVNDRLKSKKTPKDSSVRKWLTYIMLLFAATTIIGDMVTLIMNFLNGETAAAFFLKALVVLLMAGAILGYYFWNMWSPTSDAKKNKINLIIAYGLGSVLLVIFISARFIIDSPRVSKQKRVDQETVNNLQSIDMSVRNYFSKTGKLPKTLDDMRKTDLSPEVRQSSANIVYEMRIGNIYRLCADFERSNKDDNDIMVSYVSSDWRHDSGRVCFDRIALEMNE